MNPETEAARYYTRKIPVLVGKTLDGRKIPGGPYTLTQLIAIGLATPLLWFTMPLWAISGFLVNITVFGCLLWGIMWLTGRIPIGMRNPFLVAATGTRAWIAPNSGKLSGRAVRVTRPRRLYSPGMRPVVAASPATQATDPQQPVPPDVPVRQVALPTQRTMKPAVASLSFGQSLLMGEQ